MAIVQTLTPFSQTKYTITLNGTTFTKITPEEHIRGVNIYLTSTEGINSITCENLMVPGDLAVTFLNVAYDAVIEGHLVVEHPPEVGHLWAKSVNHATPFIKY